MNHFIGRQTIEIVLRKKAGAFEWQQMLSRRFQEDIAPALEVLFDRLAAEGEYLHLERLEIDLGLIKEKDILSGNWVKKIVSQVEEAIARAAKKSNAGTGTKIGMIGRFDLWLHFLQHGNLPRFAAHPGEDWKKDVLDILGLHASSADQLKSLLSRSPQSLERLALQYPTDFLMHLVELFTARKQADLAKALKEITRLGSAIPKLRWTKREVQILGRALNLLFPESFKINSIEVEKDVKAFFKKHELRTARGIEIRFWKQILRMLFVSGYRSAPEGYLRQLFLEEPVFGAMIPVFAAVFKKQRVPEGILASLIRKIYQEPDPQKGIKLAIFPDVSTEKKTVVSPLKEEPLFAVSATEDEGWHIPNSGVVLLHPYLNPFLKNRGLLEENEFKDDWSRMKAAYLLHYLASGEENPPEYRMTLPKLLCGIPRHQALDLDIRLSEEDRAEGDELLKVVVEHWAALGNTSPDGLREGFLMRDGKLTYQPEKGWRLQVERKTIDILLDKLPWTLGIVKTTWMKEMLYVEWN